MGIIVEKDMQNAMATMGRGVREYREQVLNVTQEAFGSRIGATRATVIKMEQGDPSVSMKYWIRAWSLMEVLNGITEASYPDVVLYLAMVQELGYGQPASQITDEEKDITI